MNPLVINRNVNVYTYYIRRFVSPGIRVIVEFGMNNRTSKVYILLSDNKNKTSFDDFESEKQANNNNSTDLL